MGNRSLHVVVALPLFLVACGGATSAKSSAANAPEPAAAPAPGGAADQVDMGGGPAPAAESAPSSPAAPAKAATAASDPPAVSGGAAAKSVTPLGPTTLKGKLAGGQFSPKVALLDDASLGSEVFLTIVDRDVTCSRAQLADGDKHVQVRVPWKPDHYELGGKSLGVKFGVLRGKKDLVGDASKASVDVLAAPRNEGAVGRIRIRASAPKESIDGEIDVRVCMDLH